MKIVVELHKKTTSSEAKKIIDKISKVADEEPSIRSIDVVS